MQNKPKRRWLDAQIIIASLAMTFTLALWNLIASGKPASSSGQVAGQNTQDPPAPGAADPTPTPLPTVSSGMDLQAGQLTPMKILLGGKAPVAPTAAVGSGGGSSSSHPAPVTTTRSSHP